MAPGQSEGRNRSATPPPVQETQKLVDDSPPYTKPQVEADLLPELKPMPVALERPQLVLNIVKAESTEHCGGHEDHSFESLHEDALRFSSPLQGKLCGLFIILAASSLSELRIGYSPPK